MDLRHTWMAGTVAGATATLLTFPLDTVKTRLQVLPDTYKGPLDCVRLIVKKEGVKAFYRGSLFPSMSGGVLNAISFGVYSQGCRLLGDVNGQVSQGANIVASMMGGAAAGLVRVPMDTVKTTMQLAHKANLTRSPCGPTGGVPAANSLVCLRALVRAEGVYNGLFKGTALTVLREVLQYAIYFPVYGSARGTVSAAVGVSPTHKAVVVACGGLAGVACWIPTYPVDVVKTRIQAAPTGTYKGMFDCAHQIYRKEGVASFFRGLTPTLLRAYPAHASLFLTYETALSYLRSHPS